MSPSEWPLFEANLLSEISAAFRLRSKAISYQCRPGSFSIARSIEAAPSATERLNIDAVRYCSTQFRLSVWADGGMWLRLCRPNSTRLGGWAFLVAFHGHMSQILSHDIVALFEQTLVIGSSATTSSGLRTELMQVWQAMEPRIDGTHSHGNAA